MNKKLKLITLTGLIGLSSMSNFLVVSCSKTMETQDEAKKEQKPYEINQEDLRIKLLSSAEENPGNDSNTNNLNEETIKNLKDTAEMLTDINKIMLLSDDDVIGNFHQNESIKKIKANLEKEFSYLFEIGTTNTINKKEYHNVIKMIKSFNRTIQDMLLGKDLVQTPDGQQYTKEYFLEKYKKITYGMITYITPKPQYIEDYKTKSSELIESIFDNSLIKPLIPKDSKDMINGIITNLIQQGKISIDISDLKLTLELSDVGNLISTGLGIIKDQVTPITDLINKELSESGIDIRSPEVWNTKTLVEKVLPKIITSILKIDSISNIIPNELNQLVNVLVNSVVGPFLLGILKESNIYDEQKNIDKIKEWSIEGLKEGKKITGSNIYNVLKNVIQPLYEGLKNNSIISSVLNGLSQEQTYGIPSLIESVFVNFKYLNNLLNYHYYSNPENKNDNHSFLGDVLPKLLDWALELMPNTKPKPSEEEISVTESTDNASLKKIIEPKILSLKISNDLYNNTLDLLGLNLLEFYNSEDSELLDSKKDQLANIKKILEDEFKSIFKDNKYDNNKLVYKNFLTALNSVRKPFIIENTNIKFFKFSDSYINIESFNNKYSNYIQLIFDSLEFSAPEYLSESIKASEKVYEDIINSELVSGVLPENIRKYADVFINGLLNKGEIEVDGLISLDISYIIDLLPTVLNFATDVAKPWINKINTSLYEQKVDITDRSNWTTKSLTNKVLPALIKNILGIDEIKKLIPEELNDIIQAVIPILIENLITTSLIAKDFYKEEGDVVTVDKIYELATQGLQSNEKIDAENIYNVISNVLEPLLKDILNSPATTSLISLINQKPVTESIEIAKKSIENFGNFNKILNYHYYTSKNFENDGKDFLGTILKNALDWALELMPIKEIEEQEIKKEDEILKILKPYTKKDTVLNINTLNYEDMDFANITMKEVNTIMSLYSESEIIKDSSLDIMIIKIKQTYITDEKEAIIKEINDIWESDVKVIVNTFFNTKEQEANEFKNKLIRAIKEMDRMSVPYDFYIPDQYKIIEGLDVQDLFKSENGSYELKNMKKYLEFIKNNNDINKIVEGFIQPLWSDLRLDYSTTGIQFSKTRYWTKENIKEVLLPNVLGFIDKFVNIDQLKDIKIGKLLSDIITKNSTLIKDSDWEDLANVFDQSVSKKVTGKMIMDMIYKFMNILKNNAGEAIDNLVNNKLNIIDIKPVATIEKIYNLIELIFEHKLKLWGFEDYQNSIQTILSYAIDFVVEIIEPKEEKIISSRQEILKPIYLQVKDGTITKELALLLTDYLEFSKDGPNISQSNKIEISKIDSSKLKSIKESIVQVINENWKQMINKDWTSITEEQKNNMISNYNSILTKQEL